MILVKCLCGCNQFLDFSKGRKNKKYLPGHQFRGRLISKETKEKISIANSGTNNGMYGTHGNSGSFKKGEHRSPKTEFKSLESTSLHRSIRSLNIMVEWKQWIKEWDNFTCQHCGKHGGRLHSHHIKSVIDIIKENNITTLKHAIDCEELWYIGNGITYCETCHKLLNYKGGLL